jgi:hypothetical protein
MKENIVDDFIDDFFPQDVPENEVLEKFLANAIEQESSNITDRNNECKF